MSGLLSPLGNETPLNTTAPRASVLYKAQPKIEPHRRPEPLNRTKPEPSNDQSLQASPPPSLPWSSLAGRVSTEYSSRRLILPIVRCLAQRLPVSSAMILSA